VIQEPQGLLVHIEALRKHLLRAVIVLAITTAISFAYTEQIVNWLAQPVGGLSNLTAIGVTEQISIFMKVALLAGFALALPYIALELWLFAAPGLSRKERLYGLLAIPAVGVFFVGGMAFAYFVMLPAALPFLTRILDIPTILTPTSILSFSVGLMFWVGVAFEFPLVIFVLAGMGVVNGRMLADQWRLAVVIIAIAAALITPTPDPVNMALVMGPMIWLYTLSIGLAFIARRSQKPSN